MNYLIILISYSQMGFFGSLLVQLGEKSTSLKKLSVCDAAQEGGLIDTNQLRHHLQSDIFWAKTEGYYKLLKPISDAITAAEGD